MERRKTVFISVPMKDRSDAMIERQIQLTKAFYCHARKLSAKEVKFLDNYHDSYKVFSPVKVNGINESKHPSLIWLGYALDLMSECDEVIFGYGWEKARGCKIEEKAAISYNIPIMKICKRGIRKNLNEEEKKRADEKDKKYQQTIIDIGDIQEEIHQKTIKIMEVGKAELERRKKEKEENEKKAEES